MRGGGVGTAEYGVPIAPAISIDNVEMKQLCALSLEKKGSSC